MFACKLRAPLAPPPRREYFATNEQYEQAYAMHEDEIRRRREEDKGEMALVIMLGAFLMLATAAIVSFLAFMIAGVNGIIALVAICASLVMAHRAIKALL